MISHRQELACLGLSSRSMNSKQYSRWVLLTCIGLLSPVLFAQTYKEMMQDPQYNYYDVVTKGDAYFESHPNGKGSGYKEFQRWKYFNETRFSPSGDRSQLDLNAPANSYARLQAAMPSVKYKWDWSGGWSDLGPYDANYITSHYSAGIGRVECFYVDPLDSNLLFMGSRSGGFWRSTNEGASWQNTTDDLVASGVNTIAVKPGQSDTVIINVQNAYNRYSHGIYRSLDGGINWTISEFNPDTLNKGGLGSNWRINLIKYHPSDQDLVFICASDGLYRSEDDLQTWSMVLGGDFRDIEFHPSNPDFIYTSRTTNSTRILVSDDRGMSFSNSGELAGSQDGVISVSAHMHQRPSTQPTAQEFGNLLTEVRALTS